MSFGYGMVIGHGGWWGTGGPPVSSAGKSAVQLLQESKSRYVKSDRVLVSHQEPSRPDRLHISANPNIFLSAPAHTLHPHTHHGVTSGTQSSSAVTIATVVPPPVPPRTINSVSGVSNVTPLTAVALALHSSPSTCGISLPPPLPSRSPRGAPRPRAKTQPVGDAFPRGGDLRRSLSHGPADRGNDIQSKLRRLLNTDSKESLAVQGTNEDKLNGGCEPKTPNGTFRAEVVAVSSHKSLPDLVKSTSDNLEDQKEPHRRPSCPETITLDSAPRPPPRPPRRSLGEYPPKIPARTPPPRPPPPKVAVVSYHSNGGPCNGNVVVPMGKRWTRKSVSSSSAENGSAAESSSSPEEETRRRPILRSKSDVTHERPLGGGRWEDSADSRRSSYCSEELESFFNSMGLDSSTLRLVENSPNEGSSPPIYFEEMSSEESGHFVRKESDDSDEIRNNIIPQLGSHVPLSRRSTGEPSIVEKNARVIKWLFNCQKAKSASIPRSLSSGS